MARTFSAYLPEEKPLTQKEVLEECRAYGVRASFNPATQEYRITPGGEAAAYYTPDGNDAIDTAAAIDRARSDAAFGLS